MCANNDELEKDNLGIGDSVILALADSCAGLQKREEAALRIEVACKDNLLALIEKNLSEKFRIRVDVTDIAQDAMASLLIRIRNKKLKPRSGQEIWKLLCTIALCKLRNQIRRHTTQKNDLRREDRTVVTDGLAVTVPPEAEIELRELIEMLQKNLGVEAGKILKMTLLEFTVKEISIELNITTAHVKSWQDRIRNKLKDYLSDE
jgi:RNA polymerase sigma factor (sigma-70 family)